MSAFKTIYEEVKENYAFFLIIFAYFVLSRDFVNIYVHNSVKYSIYVIMVFTATYSLLMLFYFLCCYLFHWYQVATVENIISDKYEENSEGDITRKKVTLSVRRSDGFCIELTEDWAPFVDTPVKGKQLKLIGYPFKKNGKVFHVSLVVEWLLLFLLVFFIGKSVLCDDDVVRQLMHEAWPDCIVCS